MIFESLIINVISVIAVIVIATIVQIIWYREDAPKPQLYYQASSRIVQSIVDKCQCLNNSYIPTYIWGKSGHIQSMLHALLGRFGKLQEIRKERHRLIAKDGTIVSYDIFESLSNKQKFNQVILVVPGICNNAENTYVKVFSRHMTTYGYTVAVLNHTGTLPTVELGKPKIFDYGQTDDLDLVVTAVRSKFEESKLVGLGFSLGGNILMKYLGEKPQRQNHFHFAASICQGYNLLECCDLMQDNENLRRLYNYGLTRNMLKVILRHKETFNKHFESQNPPVNLNWQRISSAKALHVLDAEFTMKLSPDKSQNKFYQENSSSQYLENIRIPMLILNANDDPLIPEQLYKYPKSLVGINHNVLFVVTKYGGHLGFFEGGYIIPNNLTWLDRMLAEYINVTLGILNKSGNE